MTDCASQLNDITGDPLRAAVKCVKREYENLRAALSPAMRREKTQWLRRDGVGFLREIGLGQGDTVLDFGCGFGAYSIPAARLVGDAGLVVPVDLRARELGRLKRRAATEGLQNIHATQRLEEARVMLKGRPCQAILLYDVLHFMCSDERSRLYRVFRNLLSRDGLLSVHPSHMPGNQPARFFRAMTMEALIEEIECTGFRFTDRKNANLWHGHGRIPGVVLNFRKGIES